MKRVLKKYAPEIFLLSSAVAISAFCVFVVVPNTWR